MASYIGQQPTRQSIVSDDSITSAKIFDGTIATVDIDDGAVTNIKLAGSIANSKLTNSSIIIAGDSGSDGVSLGETLTIAGGTGLTSTGTSNTITIGIDSTVATLTGTQTLTNKTLGATTIAGHLIPDTNITYDLGSSTFRFRDLYLSGTSIELGSATITASGSSVVLPTGSTISGGSGDVVDLNSTQTLTNKTIDTANNTITIVEADISDLGAYITASSTDTLTNKSGNISQWTNDAGYLTSFTETNDLSSAVTWVNVPDANITQSSVTQHQAALSITESQISNLGSYITASSTDTLTNKSGNISQWTNDAGYLTSETDSQTLSFSSPNLTISNGNSVDISSITSGYLQNVSEDITPQLGGDLDLNSNDITGTGNINITGTATATTFSGSGASLTSIPNGALDNSQITINGTGVSLGGSINVGDITGVTAGSGLTGGGTTGAVTLNVGAGTLIDVAADTVSVDLSELTTSTSDADGDFFAVVDSANAQKKLTKGNINISGFNNDAGYTTNVGDITGVTAGTNLTGGGTSGTVTLNMATGGVGAGTYGSTSDSTKIDTITVDAYGRVTAVATGATGDIAGVTAGSGLTGGGSSGTPTLNVGAGTGIDVSADAIAVDVSDFMSNGSNNRVLTATGADGMNAEANMTFDGSTLSVSGDLTVDTDTLHVDSSNNRVGIGTTSPDQIFHISSTDGVNPIIQRTSDVGQNSTLSSLNFKNSDSTVSSITNLNKSGSTKNSNADGYELRISNNGDGYTSFFNDGSEAMRIDSSRRLGIGVTSPSQKLDVNGNIRIRGAGIQYTGIASGTTNRIAFRWSSPNLAAAVDNVAFFTVGTNSDYRLKNNVENLSSVLDKINLLRPITFNAVPLQEGDVVNDVNHIGFIAHEVAEHFPSLVEGEKDAVNDEGNNLYQGLNYAGFTPILTKAIQELKADNDALRSTVADLTARLETLENA